MNTDDATNHQSEWATCVVCGNNVAPERAAARINHRGNTINVCSPQCLRTFAAEPDPYLARLAKAMHERELREEKVFT